jgi:Copper type II ascorbate-dependent monooxygenase, C-terminal domain
MTKHICLVAVLASCAASNDASYIPGFAPPAAAQGYTRFVTPTVDQVQPGANEMFCQWIEAPREVDRQIVDTLGFQSLGGHQVARYATSAIEEVGTSRPCTTRDMLTVTFVGAVGAEGTSSAKLPDGMAFTVPKGFALMTNTHYINATDNVIEAQSVVDVKFTDPAHPLQGAGNLAVNNDLFTIPANAEYSFDGYCKATKPLSFFMWGNHMHEWGAHAMSEIIRVDGSKELLAKDDEWSTDMTFNPAWVRWDVSTPFVVHAGDTFHVQCAWNNTTSDVLMFPTEMCVSTGFTLEAMPQSICEASPAM